MKNLKEMTSKELKEVAKNLHISNWWKMKKEDLITAISSMTEEEKVEGQKEEKIEKKLFDHYQKNWSKYGPKNDWVKFLKKYKKGEIDLIEDIDEIEDQKSEHLPPVELDKTEVFENEIDEEDDLTEEDSPYPTELEPTEVFEEDPVSPADTTAADNITKSEKKEVKKPSLRLKDLTFNGKTQTIKEWAVELEIPWPTLYDRVNRNHWPIEKALTTPLRKRRK